MSDILSVTKEVLELFNKAYLTKAQSMFVLEAVRMSIHEEMIKDIIEDSKKGHESHPGVG